MEAASWPDNPTWTSDPSKSTAEMLAPASRRGGALCRLLTFAFLSTPKKRGFKREVPLRTGCVCVWCGLWGAKLRPERKKIPLEILRPATRAQGPAAPGAGRGRALPTAIHVRCVENWLLGVPPPFLLGHGKWIIKPHLNQWNPSSSLVDSLRVNHPSLSTKLDSSRPKRVKGRLLYKAAA